MAALRAHKKPYSRPSTEGRWLHDKAPTGPAKGRIAATRALPTGPASIISNKLLVSNLHYEITPKDLMSVFGQIGTLVREPLLRYDRSGRSSGTAVIVFESAVEATRAKKQFDGYLAKGQRMAISYESPPRAPRRASSAPTTISLLNRIEKPPLAERITQDDSATKVPSAPRAFTGPVRNRPARAPRPPKAPKKNKSAAELDKELDAFMVDAETTPVAPLQDVDMA